LPPPSNPLRRYPQGNGRVLWVVLMMHNINTVGHHTSIMEDRKGILVPANTIPFTGTHWPVNVMVYRKHWDYKKGVLATIKG
jgi:hypothetical protein